MNPAEEEEEVGRTYGLKKMGHGQELVGMGWERKGEGKGGERRE